jgi:hypothetical protein
VDNFINLKTLLGATGFALVASMWQQLRAVLSQVRGILWVRVDLSGQPGECVPAYLMFKARRLPTASPSYSGEFHYVRALDRYARVAWEKAATGQIFWLGRAPIILDKGAAPGGAKGDESNNRTANQSSVSYLRGTVDHERLIQDALAWANALTFSGEASASNRFRVVNLYGRFDSGRSGELVKSAEGRGPSASDSEFKQSVRFLGYAPDDLGQPVENKPFAHLFYDASVDAFIEEVRRWHSSKTWFKERTLPWRMGALLSGPPGTGKSSLVKALAQQLGFPVYVFDLASMSNEELRQHWMDIMNSSPCVALFEDLDRVFTDDKTRLSHSTRGKGDLTLDCLLNCLSGVQDGDGVLTFVTANFPERLDPALTRPGRLDRILELGKMDHANRLKMALRIVKDELEAHALALAHDDVTPAVFQMECVRVAQDMFWGRQVSVVGGMEIRKVGTDVCLDFTLAPDLKIQYEDEAQDPAGLYQPRVPYVTKVEMPRHPDEPYLRGRPDKEGL